MQPTDRAWMHFKKRVEQRVGSWVEPKDLWEAVRYSIDMVPNPFMEFVSRLSRTGRRLWRIELRGRVYFVIYDHEIDCPITIIDPLEDGRPFDRSEIKPQGKDTIDLRSLV